MRPPLRLDLDHRDLAAAAWTLFWGERAEVLESLPNTVFSEQERTPLVCLSVRSALELLLQVKAWPAGTEVAVSAITHPDMLRILRGHGLIPVPVDLHAETMAPSANTLEQALSERTRAFLLTHLLGGNAPVKPLREVCDKRGIELWEDRAQSYPLGAVKSGAQEVSDVTFFSFGPLKTRTALAGAVVLISDPAIASKMRHCQRRYPSMRTSSLLVRTLKYSMLSTVSARPGLYGTIAKVLRKTGQDPTELMRTMSKSFGSEAKTAQLQERPHAGTLRMLCRRLQLSTEDCVEDFLDARIRVAKHLLNALPTRLVAGNAVDSVHWLFVVLPEHPEALLNALRAGGFDAISGISNLSCVPPVDGKPVPRQAQQILDHAVVVPLHGDYTNAELETLTRVLQTAQPASIG